MDKHPPSSRKDVQIPLDSVIIFGIFILIFILQFLSILVINDGKFIYTLDDPYIHIALAESIASGHYGVNTNEFSSPSSSPIWPFLLAPLAHTPLAEWMPLIINLACGLATCWILLAASRRFFCGENSEEKWQFIARVSFCLAVLACSNAVSIIFTGMEHNLQLLCALIVADGLLRFAKNGHVSKLMLAALILGPWVRYENFALTLAGCAVLFLSARPKPAIISGLVAGAGLVAFSGFLYALDLPLMPCSINAKSVLVQDADLFDKLFQGIQLTLKHPRGILLLLLCAVLLWISAWPQLSRERRLVALALAGAGILHAFFGAYDWYHRYECYIYGALIYALLLLLAERWLQLPPHWKHGFTTAMALLTAIISWPYLVAKFTVPIASNNIYQQQYQMHRFATQWWKKPIAVGDLGWVTFRNDDYVLDLWGLGSHTALHARLQGSSPTWMVDLASQHQVDLAIIYDRFVPAKAVGWIKMGELYLSRSRITAGDSVVAFYAIQPSACAEIEAQLQDFRKTLPPGVVLITRSEIISADTPNTKQESPSTPE